MSHLGQYLVVAHDDDTKYQSTNQWMKNAYAAELYFKIKLLKYLTMKKKTHIDLIHVLPNSA